MSMESMSMIFPCPLCNNMFDNLDSCTYHIMLMHSSAPIPSDQELNLHSTNDSNCFIPSELQQMFRSGMINADNNTMIETQLASQMKQLAAINNYQLFADSLQDETFANHAPILNISDQHLNFMHESPMPSVNMSEMGSIQSALGLNYVPDLLSYSQFGEGVSSEQVFPSSSTEIDIGNTLLSMNVNMNGNIGVGFDIGEYSGMTHPEDRSFTEQCFINAYDALYSNVAELNGTVNADQSMLAKGNFLLQECTFINEPMEESETELIPGDPVSRNSVEGLNSVSSSPPEESGFGRISAASCSGTVKNKAKCEAITSKKYTCRDCSYTSLRSDHLQSHMRVHTNEKPYKCPHCPYITAHSGNLTSHIRTHKGEKPYKCQLCPYASTYRSHLNCHMRTHTGEKPYKCKECSYASTNSSSLRIHVRIHNGEKPYECKECLYATSAISNLKAHMLRHTTKLKFQCDVCSYSCSDFHHLKMHKRKDHKFFSVEE
ncbi:zinc-finger double domain-containing protein [Ditylenchus destructor]|uniref:Zinc-finger double domain-containing protein n=1 Tax=Ditylenchus destructor TaxID=166010 RepID=A0AAD4MSG6_9BILA|nr:zinc-finger double domain-containing protein [Ditylenchus destructor]